MPFSINPSSGALQVSQASLDYEVQRTYTLVLRVTDRGGLFAQSTAVVNVQDVNDAPLFLDQARSIVENSPVGTPVGVPMPVADQDYAEVCCCCCGCCLWCRCCLRAVVLAWYCC